MDFHFCTQNPCPQKDKEIVLKLLNGASTEFTVSKQCSHCFQWYPKGEIKDCSFHLYGGLNGETPKDRIVTKNGIKEQEHNESSYCKFCAFKHEECGNEPFL